jgi:hypothetical protein
VTDAHIVGKTEVTISYFDYQPNSAAESSLSANSVMDQIGANHAQR